MSEKFIKLYSTSSKADVSYILNEGAVYFYASNMDKYAIKGKNLIFGVTEIVMNNLLNTQTARVETVVAASNSKIKRISVDKFLSGINSFSFALNASMVLAKQVLLTNNIIHNNIDELTGDENKDKKFSIEYYSIVEELKEHYNKRKLPWLNEFIKNSETSLIYKKGEAFYKSSEPTKIETETTNLSDQLVEYPRGSIICDENTRGAEMYILQSGSIDVIINNNKVTTIDDSGTVFGEMALLLNEKRTATLKSRNNVVLSKITKNDLKDDTGNSNEILKGILKSLAKKHYYNIIKIDTTNISLIEKNLDEETDKKSKVKKYQNTQMELRKLHVDIEELKREKDADFLQEIIDKF